MSVTFTRGGKITIEDTSPGKALSWFRAAGLLWADRNIVCKISWEQLRELNLLYGVPVKIDGGTYILRCPKGGISTVDTDSSEWDIAMAELGADTMFMNWANQFSWSQEQVVGPDMSSAVVRGFHGKQYWAYYDVSKREEEIGFRPVLELLTLPMASGPQAHAASNRRRRLLASRKSQGILGSSTAAFTREVLCDVPKRIGSGVPHPTNSSSQFTCGLSFMRHLRPSAAGLPSRY